MSEISELPTAAIARMKSDESRISKEATYDSDEVSVQYILSCISIGRTSIKNTRKHFVRRPLKINVSTDPVTETMSVLSSGRYSFGVFTPNGVIGGGSIVA